MKAFETILEKFSDLYLKNPIVLVDIGSTGGVSKEWKTFAGHLLVIAFDPDERAVNQKTFEYDLEMISSGLYDGKTTTKLYITKGQVSTSILKPAMDFLKKFPDSDRFEVEREEDITVDALDTLLGNDRRVDFLKIDTQGSEYEIIQGARQTIGKSVLGIEVEVNFVERYKNQKLFLEIDAELQAMGFYLFDISAGYWKRSVGKSFGGRKGQIIMGDALYLRTEESFKRMVEQSTEKPVLIFHAILIALRFGYLDYAYSIFLENKIHFDELERLSFEQFFERNKSTEKLVMFPGRGRISNYLLKLHKKLKPIYKRGSWYHTDEKLGNNF